MMETYSTAGLACAHRADAWNEIIASPLPQIEFHPANENDFSAELKLGQLGPIGIACMKSSRATIQRTQRHARSASDRAYSFLLQTAGKSLGRHCGNQASLEAGDFTLCDSAEPQTYRVGEGSEVLILRVPATVMHDYLTSPDRLCGRRLGAGEGLTRTAGAMARGLWHQLEIGLSAEYEECMARHLLDLMATSYATVYDPLLHGSSIEDLHYLTVERYIEEQLRDPQLNTGSIAAGLDMSRQYVRALFAARNQTVCTHVLRRRLDEAARQIGDPKWRGHTITEIAFAWGFQSGAQFARSFRDQFHVSAREYRQMRRS
jgi:AraC-like DNA-binding protein